MTSFDLAAVLAQRPLSLVFDIDGTLSSFVAPPEVAHLYPGVKALLEQVRQYAHVAIITGRGLADGAAMVGVDGITYIGTHGLEWSDGLPATHPIQLFPDAQPYIEPGRALLDLAQQQLADIPGVVVQYKQVGGTVHYRGAANPAEAQQRILALLEEPTRQLHMRLGEGKYVVEVLSPLLIHKGQALHRYAQRTAARGVLFAGDDRTDLDAILEIAHLRGEGRAAAAIAVRHADTLPALLEHADIIVDEVPGMVQLLREIAAQLASGQSTP